MRSINVSLSEVLCEWAQSQANESGRFRSVNDYIEHLIEEDRRRRTRERIDELIREGIESGEPEPLPPDWKERVRAAADELDRIEDSNS